MRNFQRPQQGLLHGVGGVFPVLQAPAEKPHQAVFFLGIKNLKQGFAHQSTRWRIGLAHEAGEGQAHRIMSQ